MAEDLGGGDEPGFEAGGGVELAAEPGGFGGPGLQVPERSGELERLLAGTAFEERALAGDDAVGLPQQVARSPAYWEGLIHVVGRVGRLLGIDIDHTAGAAALAADPVLGAIGR